MNVLHSRALDVYYRSSFAYKESYDYRLPLFGWVHVTVHKAWWNMKVVPWFQLDDISSFGAIFQSE